MIKLVHEKGVARLEIARCNILVSNKELKLFDFHKAVFCENADFENSKKLDLQDFDKFIEDQFINI